MHLYSKIFIPWVRIDRRCELLPKYSVALRGAEKIHLGSNIARVCIKDRDVSARRPACLMIGFGRTHDRLFLK
jgi:hypothetical protein